MCPSRVLVVDDNADMRESLSMILELLGHQVVAMGSSVQALQVVRDADPGAFSLAIVDVGMPTMSGYELAEALRETSVGKSLTIVACTGRVTMEDRQRAADVGFDAYLTKPIDMQALRELLQRVDRTS